MDIPYRKFFLFGVVLAPLLACALPNFAALAPTPVPQPTVALVQTARSDDELSQLSSASVPAPPDLESIEQLPPVPTLPAAISTDPIKIEAGVDYQIMGQATVVYTAAGSRPFVVRLSSSAGTAQFRTSGGVEVENVEVRRMVTKNYYAVPTPFGGTYEIVVDPETADSMTVRVFDLALGTGNISTASDFVGGDDLIRSDLNLLPDSFYIVIMQPSGELDAVMELYDTAGIVAANDDGGVGEPETFFVSSPVVAEWAIVIYSYLDSSGDFTLDVYEIP